MLGQIQKDNPNDVRIVYRHFPLSQHDKAMLAAQATEAAGLQGKFWELHDLLFKEQNNWVEKSVEDFHTWVIDQAGTLGLDKAKFTTDMDSSAIVEKVKQAQTDAETAKVDSTPYLVIDGRVMPDALPRDYQTITAVIRLTEIESRQFKACPPMTIDPKKQYTATIKTEKGDIVMKLFPDKAPLAVNSFVYLVRQGWYTGVTFHRVLSDFVAQTGDPSGTGFGGPGYAFGNEISDLKFDKEGMVGMANGGPDTNGSQFFITYGPADNLNGGYTIFAQVTAGMEVVKKLTPRNTAETPVLPPGDKITEIIISEQ